MKLAPAQWTGSAQKLINEVLKPYFLPASNIEAWQNFLVKKLDEADPVYHIGTPSPELRARTGQEQVQLTKESARVLFGDHSSATAIYTYLADTKTPTIEKMAALLIHIPHHVFDLDKFTRWATLTNNMASAGWKTSPIASAMTPTTNWENLHRPQLRKMTLLNLHPLNYFLFPNLNKSGAVFADDPRLHALISKAYRAQYGALYDSYLQLVDFDPSTLGGGDDFEIDFSATPKMPADIKVASKELISKIEPSSAFDLKLVTVSETQGHHSRTLDPNVMARGFFDIKLEFKPKSGDVQTVGFYRLNLKDLYDKKFLGRDDKGIKLMIYKTDQEPAFAVGTRKNGPFAPLPN